MGVHDFTIYDFICRNAQIYPAREAIVFGDNRLSYGEYKQKCDGVASGLIRLGIGMGDHIGIVAHNSDQYLILLGAVAKIGAVLLTVNCRLKKQEVEYIFNDGKPRFIFAGTEFTETVREIAAKSPFVRHCYVIGEGNIPEGFRSFEDLYCEENTEDVPDVPADSAFTIIYTAAVDGQPRGAILSQSNIVLTNLWNMYQYNLTPDDCNIGILPLFHVAGLGIAMAIMHAGGKNVMVERYDAERTLELIEKERGTILYNFPPILKTLMDEYEKHPFDISSLKTLVGLENPETIQEFLKRVPGAKYWTGYAQTEAMCVSGCTADERLGNVGKPSPLARIAIMDEYDNEVSVGTPGEICIRSPFVFLGYLGRNEENEDTFRNGWHHTGDIGKLDAEGTLWYIKRKPTKDLIKPGGENVYPAEVEKTILGHEAVAEVSVIGVPDQEWGEAVMAVCVLKPGKFIESQDLIDFVASKITSYKKPKHVVFVDRLPKTGSEEIDRDRVIEEYGGNVTQ